mgnify:CR=1 FL=1
MSVPPARDRQQYTLIFETLAMVGPYLSGPIEDVLFSHRTRLPFGSTITLVTAALPSNLTKALQELQQSGYGVTVLYVNEEPANVPIPENIAFYDVSGYLAARESSNDRH